MHCGVEDPDCKLVPKADEVESSVSDDMAAAFLERYPLFKHLHTQTSPTYGQWLCSGGSIESQ